MCLDSKSGGDLWFNLLLRISYVILMPSNQWKKRIIDSYTSPYCRSGISSTLNFLTSGRNPRSSIRTSTSTCFFRFNLKTKHVDFIQSFACQCHVYYTQYYNATCNAVNTHLFKTALNYLFKNAFFYVDFK